jgi:hypothetical protein
MQVERCVSPDRPSSAWARSGIFFRILPLAISASTRASVSPSIIAPRIARAGTVLSDDATVDSLIEASSSISSNRTISRLRSPRSWMPL